MRAMWVRLLARAGGVGAATFFAAACVGEIGDRQQEGAAEERIG